MSGSLFYDLGAIDQLAVNIFYGLGYNFYRLENQLRADDQKVRSQISTALSLTRAKIERILSAYRQKYLPPPTRAQPTPDPEALGNARRLEQISKLIGQLEGTIRTAPVPSNDRMTQRYRQEAQTLMALGQCDSRLVGRAEMLRTQLADKDHTWAVANLDGLQDMLLAMEEEVVARNQLIQ